MWLSRKESAVDPLTGHEVKLLELSEEEESVVWLYENFSCSCLKYLKELGTAKPIVMEMGLYFALGFICTVSFLIGTFLTFSFIEHRKKAIIPIALVSQKHTVGCL